MKKIVVSASSLPAGRNMSSQLEYIERVGTYGVDMYHLDVMDGKFTKQKSVDYAYLEQLKEHSTLLFDVHLMIVEAEKVISKYIKAGANIISLEYEAFQDKELLKKTLIKIKKSGVMAGLAIDIDTDIKVIDEYLNLIDMALILCVKVGKGGQKFQDAAIKKIKYVRNLSKDILIEADGGINAETAKDCVKAGADILVSGAYIYANDTYSAIQTLKGKSVAE